MRGVPPTLPPPFAPGSTDCCVWFVTEKGLRASGAASMKAAASGATTLRVFRRLTVCGQYQNQHQVPALRLSGKWLRQAGFDLGQKVQVRVDPRRLTICAE